MLRIPYPNFSIPDPGSKRFRIPIRIKESSVADPWHFGVDPDPDPRIHASDLWIRIRIRILGPDPAIFVIDLQDASKN